MNKISVFGASGRTGKLFTELALQNGYEVKPLVRDPSKLELQHSNLEVIQGDVLDPAKVGETIKATDAVINLIGNRKDSPPDLRRTSTQHILNAMQQNKVKRLIALSSPFAILDERDKPSFYFKFAVLMTKPLFGAALVEDGRASLDLIRCSELDWTIVRAPTLSNQPSKGNYRVGYLDANTGKIASRSDVAAFLLDVLVNDKYVRETPLISS
jgi:putative NADH-flavin reductase